MVKKYRPFKKLLRFFLCTFVVSVVASVVAFGVFLDRVQTAERNDVGGLAGTVAGVCLFGAFGSLICLIVFGALRISEGRAAKKALLPGSTPAWYPDPTARHEFRFWDSQQWTSHVADDGIADLDPLDQPAKV